MSSFKRYRSLVRPGIDIPTENTPHLLSKHIYQTGQINIQQDAHFLLFGSIANSCSMDTPTNIDERSKVNIFISYSSSDAALKDELLTQLKVLTINDKRITIWEDGLLEPGVDWDQEIKERLHAAHIVLMLISARFLTTNYSWNIEVQDTLLRQQKNEVTAVPVIISACAWTQTPLGQLQALPRKGRPINGFADRDTALLEVVNGISRLITAWKERLEPSI